MFGSRSRRVFRDTYLELGNYSKYNFFTREFVIQMHYILVEGTESNYKLCSY